mmetsp:Transcript_78393/g.229825  ORF Transcript_78393/g.229825 Transcript_78393/m.229825 type:complete len:216 (+) Transcript_78393:877-1524(+)
MSRLRTRWPVLHALLQDDHSDQGKRVQSSSHGCGLQIRSCRVSPVGRPACCGSRRTFRVRVRVPPPQAREHSDHGPHRPMMPSTGQGFSLQARAPIKGGHMRSGPSGALTTCRVMFCVPPPPQAFEQGSRIHSDTSQSPKNPPLEPRSLRSFLVLHMVAESAVSSLLHSSKPCLDSRDTRSNCARRSRRIPSSVLFSAREFTSSTLLLSAWRFRV